jgi:hypothetical protein
MENFEMLEFHEKLQLIEKLNTIDLANCSVDFLTDFINPIITGYTVNAYRFLPANVLYRGIKYENKPSYYHDLIYPPKNCTKLNRANLEGEQMFYCATKKKAPFYELALAKGDRIVLTTWSLAIPIYCNNVGYTKSNFDILSAKREIPVESLEKALKLSIDENQIIAEFLAQSFCKNPLQENPEYFKLTNAIAKNHFSTDFHGLLYPTIQYSANADNIALTKETIDSNYLRIEQIEYIEVTEIENNKYTYKILDISQEVMNGQIKWGNSDKIWIVTDEDEDIYFTDEFGSIEAYDCNGNLIPSI